MSGDPKAEQLARRKATPAAAASRVAVKQQKSALQTWQDLRDHMREARGGELVIDHVTPAEQLIQRAGRVAVCVLEDIALHHPVGKYRVRAAEVLLLQCGRGADANPVQASSEQTVLTRAEALAEIAAQQQARMQQRGTA